MSEILAHMSFFGFFISFFAFQIGAAIKNRFKFAILNPLLIAIILLIIFLKLFGISYESYNQSAKYISYFLTPATVCLAISLYEQIELLKHNFVAIMAGLLGGVISGLICVYILALIFGLDHATYATLLPKSVTTAIGIEISKNIGGVVTISVSIIIITGMVGAILADLVFRVFRIKSSIAKGIALGCASHVMGTAKAAKMGDVEGAMASLAIAVSGILCVIFASFFAKFI
ncbi:MAG: LrgB family protein [Campylobacter sp.]|nr:LrgB family protein [Campylobacter sp.]